MSTLCLKKHIIYISFVEKLVDYNVLNALQNVLKSSYIYINTHYILIQMATSAYWYKQYVFTRKNITNEYIISL